MADAFTGEVRLFPYNYAPMDWLLCDGSSLPVQAYQALYSIIGNMYGGNTQAFNIPDLRNKVVMGAGSGPGLTPRAFGAAGGSAEVTLTQEQIPAHSHTWQANSTLGNESVPNNNVLANIPNTREFKSLTGALSSPVAFNPSMAAPQGGSMSHPNQQPYLTMGYYMCLQGAYPIRP